MSAYRVPIVVAALAAIALGVPCKDGAAHGDTCGTVVDVDGTDSGEFYLLQKSMNLAEVAPHEGAKVIGGDVKIAALSQTLDDNSPRGGNAAVTQAGKMSARGSSDAAALKPAEGGTKGQGTAPKPSEGATEGGADAATGKGAPAASKPSKGATEGEAGADAVADKGADAVADKGDAAVVPSADGASSEASTTPKIVWVTPPEDAANATKPNGSEWVTPPTEAAAQSQTLPLGCIICALVIATAQSWS